MLGSYDSRVSDGPTKSARVPQVWNWKWLLMTANARHKRTQAAHCVRRSVGAVGPCFPALLQLANATGLPRHSPGRALVPERTRLKKHGS